MKHYKYKKINPFDKEVMKILKDANLSYKEIAIGFEVANSTIQYHLNPKQKENSIKRAMKSYGKLSKEQKLKKSRKHTEYGSQYHFERYNLDSEFRERQIQNIGNNFKKRRKEWIKKGLCSSCGREREDKRWKSCEICRKKMREHRKKQKMLSSYKDEKNRNI